MLKVGLTGGIGSGKSTACALFAALNVPIIDTDLIARRLVRKGEPLQDALIEAFGARLIGPDGELDRAALRQQVFEDRESLERLEQLLHPAIRQAVQREQAGLQAPYVLIAIPLLLEKGWQQEVDRILVVDCDETTQLARASMRDQTDSDAIRRIMAQQCSRAERLAAANDILHNEGSVETLRTQVEQLHQHYLELAQHSDASPHHLRTPAE